MKTVSKIDTTVEKIILCFIDIPIVVLTHNKIVMGSDPFQTPTIFKHI